jgi:Fibronectin type III domain
MKPSDTPSDSTTRMPKESSAKGDAVTTVPNAPTAVTPSRAGSSAALVTFSPPEDDGGSGITLYTVRAEATGGGDAQARTGTGQNSPIMVGNLQNGNEYTFTVRATNANGDSELSEPATLVIGSAPSAPLAVSASRANGKSTVSFQAPTDDGGAPITHYTVKATDTVIANRGGQTVSAGSSPIEITGLTNGDAYTFSVTATNQYGTSEAATSGLVVPGGQDPSAPQAPWPDALSFTVHKRIGALQLQDELRAVVHQDCLVAVVNESPFGVDGTLFVIPNTVDETQVQSVVDAHVFNPNYGTPNYLTEFNNLLRQVNDNPDEDLTAEEIQVALKGMLARIPLNG